MLFLLCGIALPLDFHLVCSLFGSPNVTALETFSDHPTLVFPSPPLTSTCFNYSSCYYWTHLLTCLFFHTTMTAGAFSILLMLHHQDLKSPWHMTGAQGMFAEMFSAFFCYPISFPVILVVDPEKELAFLSPGLAKKGIQGH